MKRTNNPIEFMAYIVFVLAVALLIVSICLDCAAVEITAGYDPATDYMELMIECVLDNDVENGKVCEEHRNRKIDQMGIDTKKISFEDLYYLGKAIHSEAGSYWIPDSFQIDVGSVILNRVSSPEFPDSIRDVLTQKNQYFAWIHHTVSEIPTDERAIRNALKVLEEGSTLPASVVFQANFRQGSSVYKTYEDEKLHTTYFCISNYPEKYEIQCP